MESASKNVEVFNGKVAAAIISASIGLILMGILTYTRGPLEDVLTIFKPIAAVGGIWLYGYIAWIASWMVLYKAIGKKQRIGNWKIWISVFFVSLVICTILQAASLDWPPLA